jgi:Fe(3+) dicitrate transport protein
MKPLTLILVLLASIAAFADNLLTTTVSGRVVNEETGEGLPGVHVIVDELNMGSVTDGNGSFVIHDIPLGKHSLTIKMVGYTTLSEELELTEAGLELEFKLKEELYILKGALVEANSITGGMTKVSDLTGSAHYISPKELEKFSYNDIHRILRNIPGVNVQDEERGIKLYPNPSNGYFRVDVPQMLVGEPFIVIDPRGKEVFRFTSNASNRLDLTGLESGIYLLNCESSSDIESLRFVIY